MRALFFLLGSATALGVVACGGGGGSTLPAVQAEPTTAASAVATNPPGSSPNAKSVSVTFSVLWTKPGTTTTTTAARVKRAYLSNSTTTVTIAVNGGTPSSIANPYLTPGAVAPPGPTQTTSITISAPLGSDTFAIQALDAKNNLLGAGTVVQTIVIDKANTVSATLDGNLAEIAVAAASSPFVSLAASSSPPAYTVVGQAPEDFVLTPEDADGNVIVSPGTVPPINLRSATPASVSVASTTSTNEFAVQSHAPGVTITLTATGSNLAGTPVSTTFTVSTLSAIYIANHGITGPSGLASPESVSIYPSNATAASTPIATIAGSNTDEVGIQFPAVDANGVLYLSNQGPAPGTKLGPTSGYVTIFDGAAQIASAAASGNVPPTGIISGLARPEGLAIDPSGHLYVMLERSLVEYPASPTGASTPIAAIGPPAPSAANTAPPNTAALAGCYGTTVDSSGLIYAACSDVLNVYPANTTGNTAPEYQIGALTSLQDPLMPTYGSDSWLSVAVDSSGNIYAPTANNNLDRVDIYAAGSNDSAGGTSPIPTIAEGSGAFSIPWGIAIDTVNNIYVTNYASSTVQIFASETAIEGLGTPVTLTNGISSPYGIAVR